MNKYTVKILLRNDIFYICTIGKTTIFNDYFQQHVHHDVFAHVFTRYVILKTTRDFKVEASQSCVKLCQRKVVFDPLHKTSNSAEAPNESLDLASIALLRHQNFFIVQNTSPQTERVRFVDKLFQIMAFAKQGAR